MSELFTVHEKEEKAMKEWVAQHRPVCTARIGTIGGRLSYCFTPTSIGVIFKIKCNCGQEIDVTDYESW